MSWVEILTFALMLGLGSSAHCAGMCGVFAVQAATGPNRITFAAYILGKAFTYAFLGALAGWFGEKVINDSADFRAYAALFAAAFLILAGVGALVPSRAVASWTGYLVRWLAPLFAAVRSVKGTTGKFALGAVTGLLPCGVVYLGAAQSVLAGSVLKSVTLMALLGLGTAPSLLVVGLLSEKMKGRLGPVALRVAGGILLIIIGSITAWRALVPLLAEPGNPASCCH